MAFVTRRTLYLFVGLVLGFVVAVAGVVWSGIYNIGADDPHTRPIYAVLEVARARSIERRATAIDVPDLADPAQVIQGAGNYDAMCTGCHLTPGAPPTELSRGLYPAPPNLSLVAVDPAKAFWVIKHGIKASGMPAWGESMEDAYIWNMVAFLQTLPELDAAQYRELVGQSGGHSHGGGESDGHAHADAPEGPGPGSADAVSSADADATAEPRVHEHADGSLHDHGPPAPVPEAEPRVHEHDGGSMHDHGPPVTTTDPEPDVPEPTPAATATEPATAPPDPASAPAPDAADESATPDPAEHDEHTDHHH